MPFLSEGNRAFRKAEPFAPIVTAIGLRSECLNCIEGRHVRGSGSRTGGLRRRLPVSDYG